MSLAHQLLEGGTTQLVTLMNVQVDVVAQEGHGDVSLGDWLAVEALDDTDVISTDLDQVLQALGAHGDHDVVPLGSSQREHVTSGTHVEEALKRDKEFLWLSTKLNKGGSMEEATNHLTSHLLTWLLAQLFPHEHSPAEGLIEDASTNQEADLVQHGKANSVDPASPWSTHTSAGVNVRAVVVQLAVKVWVNTDVSTAGGLLAVTSRVTGVAAWELSLAGLAVDGLSQDSLNGGEEDADVALSKAITSAVQVELDLTSQDNLSVGCSLYKFVSKVTVTVGAGAKEADLRSSSQVLVHAANSNKFNSGTRGSTSRASVSHV